MSADGAGAPRGPRLAAVGQELWFGIAAGLLTGSGVGLCEALWVLAAQPTGEYLALVHAAVIYGLLGVVVGVGVGALLALWGLLRPRFPGPLAFSLAVVLVGLLMGGTVLGWRVDQALYLSRGLPGAASAALAVAGLGWAFVGLWLGPVIFSRTPLKILLTPRGTLAAWVATVGLAALFAWAPSNPYADADPAPRRDLREDLGETPDVLLVTVESLRSDALPGGAAVPGRPLPGLRRLQHEGLTFSEHVAPAPWTRPSLGTVMTAQWPAAHGCDVPTARLGSDRASLAEALQDRGFVTLALPARFDLARGSGFEQGFDWVLGEEQGGGLSRAASGRRLVLARTAREALREFRGLPPRQDELHRPAHALVEEALDVIARNRARGNRWFAWVHIAEPSLPYFSQDGVEVEEGAEPGAGGEIDRDRARELYGEEVAAVDGALDALLSGLESEGGLDDVLVIVVGLHGEELFDHGHLGHGDTLYDELLRSPLLVRPPGGGEGRVLSGQVRTMDIAPTILDVVGGEVPTPWQGRSLGAGRIRGEDGGGEGSDTLADRVAVATLHREGAIMEAVRFEGWKLVRSNRDHPRNLPAGAIYDLTEDAAEQRDLSGQVGARQAELSRLLRQELVASHSWRTVPSRPEP